MAMMRVLSEIARAVGAPEHWTRPALDKFCSDLVVIVGPMRLRACREEDFDEVVARLRSKRHFKPGRPRRVDAAV